MAKKTSKKTSKKTATKKTSAKPRRRFEGAQAMIPGVAPRKAGAARVYAVQGVDGERREITMPAAPTGPRVRRNPMASGGAAGFTARLEMRISPDQAIAWDRMAALAQLSRGEWIRSVCDAAVKAGAQ